MRMSISIVGRSIIDSPFEDVRHFKIRLVRAHSSADYMGNFIINV